MKTPLTNVLFARAIRQACRSLFDDVDLSTRTHEWVDRDSFDAGLVAAAHFLLQRADRFDTGELEADV